MRSLQKVTQFSYASELLKFTIVFFSRFHSVSFLVDDFETADADVFFGGRFGCSGILNGRLSPERPFQVRKPRGTRPLAVLRETTQSNGRATTASTVSGGSGSGGNSIVKFCSAKQRTFLKLAV